MRVLDYSAHRADYSVSQFLRGALMYARQNWWKAFWIGFVSLFALCWWVFKGNAGYGFAASVTAFILTFWWVFDPHYKQNPQEYSAPVVAWVLAISAPERAYDISQTPSIGLSIFLSFTSFALAWPWIERRKTPDNFVVWIVSCAAALIVLVFIVEFVVGFLT